MATLHLANEIFNLIYPVGSVYLSVNQTNPGTLFGGTWARITDGFLYCASGNGGGQGNLQGSAKTGGPSNNNTGSTTLTVHQLPNSVTVRENRGGTRNAGNQNWSSGLSGWGNYENGYGQSDREQGHTHSLNSHTHNIPYTGVVVWKRTA